MKRIGSIYQRDVSKSKQKIEKVPLQEITLNNSLNNNPRFRYNQFGLNHESKDQGYSNSGNKHYGRRTVQTNSREISFSGSQHQEMQSQHQEMQRQEKGSESEVVRKLKSVNAIIHEIGSLKNCRLQPSQSMKLNEIQDRLLAYERKLLQGQIKNYS